MGLAQVQTEKILFAESDPGLWAGGVGGGEEGGRE